ncbi:hypothetical protein [Borreliella burgdorferi]|uniref:Uncharacterized protein n=1 Tax=Borreliella burgdorferi 118a TaxID=476210 RepID=A0A7U4DIT2_BORBG|nr:hypothetical protein [Borreliella burgdorferi]ACL34335.1 protein p23 [Borreliella burgdorferi 156a]ACN23907.1 hypothetical protein BBU64B_Y0002 [Borreliella burgdorferi 64b]ACN92748.1 hypothetical protein BBU118A_Y02 [Borreliella burgdorferi 118a]ATH10738.1 hypothetical protein BHT49_06085 [Borreliella burgdorferi]MDK7384310.1 hypothetical protein [Borreliella burgdorferi]
MEKFYEKEHIYFEYIFIYTIILFVFFDSTKINKIKNPGFDFKKIEEENITKYNKDTIKNPFLG